jgi:hypothetical protein
MTDPRLNAVERFYDFQARGQPAPIAGHPLLAPVALGQTLPVHLTPGRQLRGEPPPSPPGQASLASKLKVICGAKSATFKGAVAGWDPVQRKDCSVELNVTIAIAALASFKSQPRRNRRRTSCVI